MPVIADGLVDVSSFDAAWGDIIIMALCAEALAVAEVKYAFYSH